MKNIKNLLRVIIFITSLLLVNSTYGITGNITKSASQLNIVETQLPSKQDWKAINYVNGKFIALSNSIEIYSTDGINWTQINLPYSNNWKSVTYGNGYYVLMPSPGNIALYSLDAINWKATLLPYKNLWSKLVYGNNKFVAISSNNKIIYSEDGIGWGIADTEKLVKQPWTNITYGNGKFIAINNHNDSVGSNIIAYSIDGINWENKQLPIEPSKGGNWPSIEYGNNQFLTISFLPIVSLISKDGINWNNIYMPNPPYMNDIDINFWWKTTYGNNKFIAVDNFSTAIAYLDDNSSSWLIQQLDNPLKKQVSSMAFGNGKFILMLSNSDKAFVITD